MVIKVYLSRIQWFKYYNLVNCIFEVTSSLYNTINDYGDLFKTKHY